jgi:hypothetical protein
MNLHHPFPSKSPVYSGFLLGFYFKLNDMPKSRRPKGDKYLCLARKPGDLKIFTQQLAHLFV